MLHCTGELLDGSSTDAIEVQVEVNDEGLSLIFPDGEICHHQFSEFNHINETANGYSLTFRQNPLQQGPNQQLHFIDSHLYSTLLDIINLSKSPHIHHRIANHFRRLKLWQIALFTISTLIIFLSAFFSLLQHAYNITPSAYDTYLGNKIDSTFSHVYTRCESQQMDTFLSKAMERLSQPDDRFPHRVIVINDPTQNALSLPGGTIYLFRGLLDSSKSPDEILGILGHEISHAEHRHSVRQIIQSMGIYYMSTLSIGIAMDGFDFLQGLENTLEMSSLLFTLRYSRQFEREADSLGIERLHRANLQVGPLDSILTRLTPPPRWRDRILAIFSTHPMQQERSSRIAEARKKETFSPDTFFIVERSQWDMIKKCCTDSMPSKPFWKKLISRKKNKKSSISKPGFFNQR
jgi:Zn-dependent protease with chaperone function